jgi:hypothetical protein
MFKTLAKTVAIVVGEHTFSVKYFEIRTLRGARRYSAELVLRPGDPVILDDDSIANLEVRLARLVPATLYSRMLAGRVAAAHGVQ